ncbi:unnamed protein product [Rhizophagus irregularis]|nr:unnamed protein product [Rhizophagus irregularis]
MDQLVSADGRYLLTWSEIKINNDTKYKGIIPRWFKDLEDNYTLSNHRTLTTPLTDPVNIPQRLHRCPKITQGYTTHRFEWTIHWHNESRQIIFGKTLAQDSNNHSSITYSEHFIPLRNDDLASLNIPTYQIPLILIPCSGCRLDSHYPSMDIRPQCVLSNQTNHLNIFSVHKSASREHKFFVTTMKRLRYKKYFVSTKPLLTLNHVAYNIFLQRAGISTSLVTPHTTTLPINQISPNDPLHIIDASLICNDMIKNDLKNISTNFADYQNFHFYTDGSVKALGQQGCKSGVIKCVECKCKDDTATHVCLCNSHIEDINRILSTYKTKLGALLMAQSNSFTFDLSDRLNKSNLFAHIEIDDTTSHSMIPRSLPGLLLLYNLIPTELTYLFYNYIGDKKTRESLFLKYTDDLIRELNHVTWTKRLRSFKKWEKSLNITRKDKRYYRQRFRNRHNQDVPDRHNITSTIVHSDRNYSGVKYRLPYEKSLLTFNSTAHIRWTSSNFLHSGSWESHRDELQFNVLDSSYINDVWCSLGN